MSFENKVVLITGAGTGIGRAAAAFNRRGALVVINGRREEVLSDAARELDPSGERVAAVAGDIGEVATGRRMVDTALERFGGVDILISAY